MGDLMDIDNLAPSIRELRTDLSGQNDQEEPFISQDRSLFKGAVVLVLDTNVLISRLPFLSQVVNIIQEQIQQQQVPSTIVFMVPVIVIRELDGLKNSNKRVIMDHHKQQNGKRTQSVGLGELARQSVSWLKQVINDGVVMGQRRSESSAPEYMHQAYEGDFDDRVLDCCVFFKNTGHKTALLTEDSNLIVKAGIEGVNTFSLDVSNSTNSLPNFFASIHQLINNQTSNNHPHLKNNDNSNHDQIANTATSYFNNLKATCAHILSPLVFSHLLHRYAYSDHDILEQVLVQPPGLMREYNGIPDIQSTHWPSWTASRCLELMERFWHSVFEEMYEFADLDGHDTNHQPDPKLVGGSSTSKWATNNTSLSSSSSSSNGQKRRTEAVRQSITRLKNEMLSTKPVPRKDIMKLCINDIKLICSSKSFLTPTSNMDQDIDIDLDSPNPVQDSFLPDPHSLAHNPEQIDLLVSEAQAGLNSFA